MSGQFGWFKSLGATDAAVAVLNDQPELFTILILVIVGLLVQTGILYSIHYFTYKPEQAKKRKDAKEAKAKAKGKATTPAAPKPPAAR